MNYSGQSNPQLNLRRCGGIPYHRIRHATPEQRVPGMLADNPRRRGSAEPERGDHRLDASNVYCRLRRSD